MEFLIIFLSVVVSLLTWRFAEWNKKRKESWPKEGQIWYKSGRGEVYIIQSIPGCCGSIRYHRYSEIEDSMPIGPEVTEPWYEFMRTSIRA